MRLGLLTKITILVLMVTLTALECSADSAYRGHQRTWGRHWHERSSSDDSDDSDSSDSSESSDSSDSDSSDSSESSDSSDSDSHSDRRDCERRSDEEDRRITRSLDMRGRNKRSWMSGRQRTQDNNDDPRQSMRNRRAQGQLLTTAQCTEAIWAADTNSFPDNEIVYNLTGPRLFTYVNDARLQTGVYPSFIALVNGFNPQLGEVDPDLFDEINNFLDKVMPTGPMQTAYMCVKKWGCVKDEDDFKELLRKYWFLKFKRGGRRENDSSGFEHTFQGEISTNRRFLTGWHGWVRTYDTENKGHFRYGTKKADCGNNLIGMKNFSYKNVSKMESSIWIGKSPELQFALYTLCFMTTEGDCTIEVDGGKKFTMFTQGRRELNTINAAFLRC